MLNLNILSLLFMMLCMTMNSNSLTMSPNTGDWSRTHTWSQSASYLKITLGGGNEVVKLLYSCFAVTFFKFRGSTSPRRQPPHNKPFIIELIEYFCILHKVWDKNYNFQSTFGLVALVTAGWTEQMFKLNSETHAFFLWSLYNRKIKLSWNSSHLENIHSESVLLLPK